MCDLVRSAGESVVDVALVGVGRFDLFGSPRYPCCLTGARPQGSSRIDWKFWKAYTGYVMRSKNSERHIFGRETRNQTFQNFTLIESLYPPNETMPRHTHEIAHVSFVLRGSFTEICGVRKRLSKATSLIVHPADEDHTVNFEALGARIFSFRVDHSAAERIRNYTDILESPSAFSGGEAGWLAVRLYRESLATDAVMPLVIESLAFEIIAAVSRRDQTARDRDFPKWLTRAQEYLHAHFTENISFSLLAETLDTNPVYLSREFRRRFNCTMGEYVHRLRIEEACREISESDASLIEIALSIGFYDQSYFTNVFKRVTGETPSRYRAMFGSS